MFTFLMIILCFWIVKRLFTIKFTIKRVEPKNTYVDDPGDVEKWLNENTNQWQGKYINE